MLHCTKQGGQNIIVSAKDFERLHSVRRAQQLFQHVNQNVKTWYLFKQLPLRRTELGAASQSQSHAK